MSDNQHRREPGTPYLSASPDNPQYNLDRKNRGGWFWPVMGSLAIAVSSFFAGKHFDGLTNNSVSQGWQTPAEQQVSRLPNSLQKSSEYKYRQELSSDQVREAPKINPQDSQMLVNSTLDNDLTWQDPTKDYQQIESQLEYVSQNLYSELARVGHGNINTFTVYNTPQGKVILNAEEIGSNGQVASSVDLQKLNPQINDLAATLINYGQTVQHRVTIDRPGWHHDSLQVSLPRGQQITFRSGISRPTGL